MHYCCSQHGIVGLNGRRTVWEKKLETEVSFKDGTRTQDPWVKSPIPRNHISNFI